MKLYHGSPNRFGSIRKSQAQQGKGMDVPKDELLDAIYLTPYHDFALAVASMPEGAAHIDEETRSIKFEKPDLFDPEKEVYIYEIDSGNIPPEYLKKVDELQYAVVGMEELKPTGVSIHKAGEITRHYELKNWKQKEGESGRELKFR